MHVPLRIGVAFPLDLYLGMGPLGHVVYGFFNRTKY